MQAGPLLVLSVVLVVASVGLVVGVRHLNRCAGLDRLFIGDAILALAWVLPEFLIAGIALLSPGRMAYHPGDPYLAVGATMGSAALNVLAVGLLNAFWPGRGGLEVTGAGRPLTSAAVLLLVMSASFIGLIVGTGPGVNTPQLAAGGMVILVYLFGLRLVQRETIKEIEPDPLFHRGGSWVRPAVLTASSLVALAYASPLFVERAIPWFWPAKETPAYINARLMAIQTIGLGSLLALPDFMLGLLDVRAKASDPPLPRLLLASAALAGFTAVAGLDPDTLWDAYASSMLGTFLATTFLAAVAVVLLLATSTPRSVRMRGLILTAIAVVGLALTVLVLRS